MAYRVKVAFKTPYICGVKFSKNILMPQVRANIKENGNGKHLSPLGLTLKDNFSCISIECLGLRLQNICWIFARMCIIIPLWLGKLFRFTVFRFLKNVFVSQILTMPPSDKTLSVLIITPFFHAEGNYPFFP